MLNVVGCMNHNLTSMYVKHSFYIQDIAFFIISKRTLDDFLLREKDRKLSVFLRSILFEIRYSVDIILCLFFKIMFEIWARTICLTYHFIDKSFLQHFVTNDASSHLYKSDIQLQLILETFYFKSQSPIIMLKPL